MRQAEQREFAISRLKSTREKQRYTWTLRRNKRRLQARGGNWISSEREREKDDRATIEQTRMHIVREYARTAIFYFPKPVSPSRLYRSIAIFFFFSIITLRSIVSNDSFYLYLYFSFFSKFNFFWLCHTCGKFTCDLVLNFFFFFIKVLDERSKENKTMTNVDQFMCFRAWI